MGKSADPTRRFLFKWFIREVFTENRHVPLTLLGTGDTLFDKTRCRQSWTFSEEDRKQTIQELESVLLQIG